MIFNGFVRLFTGLSFQDTQCGFKAFVRERSYIIFEQQRIEGFGFDPEPLFLAKHHGLRAAEVPVRWSHHPATKVRVFRDSLKMFLDLASIRWNWLVGRYPRRRTPAVTASISVSPSTGIVRSRHNQEPYWKVGR